MPIVADSSTDTMKSQLFMTFLFVKFLASFITFLALAILALWRYQRLSQFEHPNQSRTENAVKIVLTFEPVMQFWCPSKFRILRKISTHCYKIHKTDILAGIYIHKNIHTYIHTDMATLWPTWPTGPSWWKG